MKPSEVSAALKRIASKIENSKSPDKDLVINDLNKVIHSMDKFKNAADPKMYVDEKCSKCHGSGLVGEFESGGKEYGLPCLECRKKGEELAKKK